MYSGNVYIIKYRKKLGDFKTFFMLILISIIIYTLTINVSHQEQQSPTNSANNNENDISIYAIAAANINNDIKSSISSSTITFNKIFINIVSNVRGPHGNQPQPITIILTNFKQTNYLSQSIILPPFAKYLKDPVGFNVPSSFISVEEQFKTCAIFHNIKKTHFSSDPFSRCHNNVLKENKTYDTFIMPCLKPFSNILCKD